MASGTMYPRQREKNTDSQVAPFRISEFHVSTGDEPLPAESRTLAGIGCCAPNLCCWRWRIAYPQQSSTRELEHHPDWIPFRKSDRISRLDELVNIRLRTAGILQVRPSWCLTSRREE